MASLPLAAISGPESGSAGFFFRVECSRPGQSAQFLLQSESVKSCRVPLIREEQQIEWLSRKLNGVATLEMESIIPMPRPPLCFRKNSKAGKLVTVTFDGILQVVNSGALIELIQTGIGPAKAFGCGLLSLARS